LRKLGALVAGLVAAAGVPAAASAAPVTPELDFAHVALVPGGPAKLQTAYFWAYEQTYTLHNVTAVLDASKLAGVAEPNLEFDSLDHHCTAAGDIYTCKFESLSAPDGFAAVANVSFRAADGAKPGAEGVVKLTVTTDELGTLTRTAKITVAEGVQLAAASTALIERSAKPGATVTSPLGVRNEGANAVTGVDMFFFIDPWYGMAKHYSNCYYGASAAYCHFDTTLKPGATYALSEDMGVKVRTDIPAPELIGQTYHWLTPTDNRDNIDLVEAQKPKRGTDGTLSLKEKATASVQGVPQTDTSGEDWQDTLITLTGSQQADLGAVGAEAKGATGATVTATVGVRNLGPAFVFGFPDPAAKVTVRIPAGATVVTAPEGCATSGADYVCTTTAMPLDVTKSEVWPFQLRIGQSGTLTGEVAVKSSQPDPNAANDTAKLVINPVAAPDTGGQGGGSGLPITGAPALLIAGVGLVLVLGGGAAFVISRRRSRFVA
jgi:hypothetical protein